MTDQSNTWPGCIGEYAATATPQNIKNFAGRIAYSPPPQTPAFFGV
ncbi:MAG: hypothetical protein ABF759_14515 [Acetobacter malorum]